MSQRSQGSSLTLSNSLDKISLFEEMSLADAYESEAESRISDDGSNDHDDALSEHQDGIIYKPGNAAISNERIKKGDDILGMYVVTSEAIHGGMGSVWRVHHKGWNIDLAMKRPQPAFFAEGSEKRKKAFVKECENWIRLVLHPCVVSCYYVREIGGVPTIFSEWMDNGSLRDRIRDDSLYLGTVQEVQARILDIAIQSARGLQYSHEHDLLHQDVKPGNILLGKDWTAKVADFGLASAARDPENPSAVSGYTAEYCPKEQMEGAKAGAWMDVYAWALTVLEMFCGSRPWKTGAQAKEMLEDYALFAESRIPVPSAMQDLLIRCVQNSESGDAFGAHFQIAADEGGDILDAPLQSFGPIIPLLEAIYTQLTGKEYSRSSYSLKSETADLLNNYALSFLDLKRGDLAKFLWDGALRLDPNHKDSYFNRALYELRSGQKYDYEILDEMNSRPKTRQQDLDEIIREAGGGGVLEASARNSTDFFLSNRQIHTALSGDDLLIADYNIGPDTGQNGQGPLLHRVSRKTGERIETDPMDAIRALNKPISRILLAPGGEKAVIFLGDKTIVLYDTHSRTILKTLEHHPITDVHDINEFTASFGRDGGPLALRISTSYTFVLYLSNVKYKFCLDYESMGMAKFVCRPPGKGLLFRGENPSYWEGQELFCVDAEGSGRRIFHFGQWPKVAIEYDCEPFPFLFYSFEDTGKGFYLVPPECASGDAVFWQKVSLSVDFAKTLPSPIFFDPKNNLYITRGRDSGGKSGAHLVLWDLAQQKMLCSVSCDTELFDEVCLNASYDPASRELLLCSAKPFFGQVHWRTIVLPEVQENRQPAAWRISRIKSSEKAIAEEQKIEPEVKRFVSACENEPPIVAREIYRNMLNLWGFDGSDLCFDVEDVVDAMYKKIHLNAVRPHGETASLPECCIDSRRECVWIDGNHYILYAPDDPSKGAQIAEPDGTLIREIRFPASARRVWVRRFWGIFAVSDTLEVTIYDLKGREKEVIPPALSPDEPAAVLMDLDLHAENLLYKDKDNRVVERELRTGATRRLRKCVSWEEGCYLNDGSVLLPLLMSAEFDEDDFEYVDEYFPRFFTAEGEELEQDYSDSHHVFGVGRIDHRSGKLKGCFPFEAYLEMIYEKCSIRTSSQKNLFLAELGFVDYKSVEDFGENKTTVVFDVERVSDDPEEPVNEWTRGMNVEEETILFSWGEFLCGRREDEIWIRELRSDSLTPVFSHKIRASRVLLRPDGRELYAEVTENGSTVWKVFRLQYAYN